jgi:hypothetical protein
MPGFHTDTELADNRRHWRNLHKAVLLHEDTNVDLLDDQEGTHYETRVAGETVTNPNLLAGTGITITPNGSDVTVAAVNNGDVTGPGSATVCNAACFDDTTGKVLRDSGFPTAQGVIAAAVLPDNAIVSGDGGARGVKDSGFTAADLQFFTDTIAALGDYAGADFADNIVHTGDFHIQGKLTVDDMIDPTGMALTPVAANPMVGEDYENFTLWVDEETGLLMYGSEVVVFVSDLGEGAGLSEYQVRKRILNLL